MDRALNEDEPLIVFKTIFCSWFSTLNFTLFRSLTQGGCLSVCYHGNHLPKVSEVVGNPLANLLKG
jgi:hypothetical protein